MRLFVDNGFDATTIDQIVSAVGISRRSFFRYFGTKEDILFGDLGELGRQLRDSLEAQPPAVGPWDALRAAFLSLRPEASDSLRDLEVQRLLQTSTSLRARHVEKHQQWLALFAPDIARRVARSRGLDQPDAAAAASAHALVSAMLACLDSAMAVWAQNGGDGDIVDLYDAAVKAVRS